MTKTDILCIDGNHYAMYCYFASKLFSEKQFKEYQRDMRRSLQRIDPETQPEEFAKAVAQIDDPETKNRYILDGFKTMFHHKLIELVVFGKYDGVVFAQEGGVSWRKEIYPEYKANRKPKWNPKTNQFEGKFGAPEHEKSFFDVYEECVSTLTTLAPSIWRLAKPKCEGDDVIATFVNWAYHNRPNLNITIMSRDRDYLQLFKYGNCRLYDPQDRKMIACADPEYALQTKIICGDTSDNIKNVRRGYAEVKAMEYYNKGKMDEFLSVDGARERYELNRRLVDFQFIPIELTQLILEEIDKRTTNNQIYINDTKALHKYYIKNGLFRVNDDKFNQWYTILRNTKFGLI